MQVGLIHFYYGGKRLVWKTDSLPVQGYARMNQAEAALDVMREFWQQGGEPDDSMFEVLVTLCVRTGEFRKALQVVHAMDKLGRPADKMRIKKVLEEFYRCERHPKLQALGN